MAEKKTTKKNETKKKVEKKEIFKGYEIIGDRHKCPNCGASFRDYQLRSIGRCPVCGYPAEEE